MIRVLVIASIGSQISVLIALAWVLTTLVGYIIVIVGLLDH